MEIELVTVETLKAADIFTGKGDIQKIVAHIQGKVTGIETDISTPAGRKDLASAAHKISKAKTALDNLGKTMTEDAKAKIKIVDTDRKYVRDTLDELRVTVRAPLTKWEDQEKDRVSETEARLSSLASRDVLGSMPTVTEIEERQQEANALYQFDWREFLEKADIEKARVDAALGALRDNRIKYDEEQAELAKLRQEAADREAKENEERIATAAAEEAKAKADKEAAAAADKERKKVEAQKAAAAKKAEEEKAAAEQKAEEARQQADRERAIAETAKAEAEEKIKAAEQEAKDAAQAERDKIEAEQRQQAEATAKREADKKHRGKIHSEALTDLKAVSMEVSEIDLKAIITAIAQGNVRNVGITY
jgi:hypothetical protein